MTELKITFIDVGQGDSTLIALPNGEYMLVDVCRSSDHGIDTFKLLDDVLPDNGDGRKKLAYLVITHAHDDHITGIGELYDRYAVESLWVPQHEDRKQIAKHFGEYQRVIDEHPDEQTYQPQGSRTPLDVDLGEGVSVRCFSPPGYIEIGEELTEEEAKKLVHENCLVIRLSFGGVSVILTGDSDLGCWERVVGYYADRPDEATGTEVLNSTVLHASHHGSRTFIKEGGEDSEAWLDALETIDPEAVIVSVGENNRHKHPHKDMIDAYKNQVGAENVHETRETGTILLTIGEDGDWSLELDGDGGQYATSYGWDDEDDDNGGGGNSDDRGGSGGGTTARRVRVPPPGFEKAPQSPPRRERYGS
jgi:beta-lactamase superfamily II metal-dependent hydrolase